MLKLNEKKSPKSLFWILQGLILFINLNKIFFQDWYGLEQPSLLASSCLAAAARLTGQPWCEQLEAVTGSSQDDLVLVMTAALAACTDVQVTKIVFVNKIIRVLFNSQIVKTVKIEN